MKNWTVIGHHSIREVLKHRPKKVEVLSIRETYGSSAELSELFKLAQKHSVKIQLIGDKKLNALQQGHQGAVLTVPPIDEDVNKLSENSIVLVLDGIEDPHNLGAILRTAWLMEVDKIYVPKDRAAKLTATALKVASGGAEYVPVETVTNVTSLLDSLKKEGYWVSGLAEGGTDKLHQWEPEEKVCIVIGAEDAGIRKKNLEACDRVLEIWQTPGGASYNASVAAALVMGRYRSSKLSS